ncbi:unnamed protein product [Cryptosporidium hominis]|uniref:Uncharacterized protein n=1 Tax=Cryptosporidium hominis TaxID=237895 RepID=A0A0S4TKV7_CRYHO|nr:hypothetical protein [Cryptosporidium hominis TU502]OLQ19369.1 hypothetical protein ChTU502y2012_421g0640 [Cryptosporidium hominis]PPA64744.1 hypothetical protein ChUKH1_01685 [Cryptosporidium hominis]PPS98235.1 Uncharacterized protein GY17_00000739 [Cryptosporidium hominis]CUV07852.1 unnamed protein product [Cryptosporidium hominis]|eukprot:PPS98235.1 Uncharacterized protein GY17_00000739 [Cryptosporidium hominis]
MSGSFKTYTNNGKHDEISHLRYRNALEIERSNHTNELAKKAEKLRLIYKTRFEEDLRAFMVSHKAHDACLNSHAFKCINPKPLRTGNICSHKFRITSKLSHNNSEVQNSSFIPTWAWPASLRNNEDLKLISLFYTAETNVPLSPSQVGGKRNKETQICNPIKQNTSNDKKNLLKALKISKKDEQEKLNNQNIFEPNNLKQNQRQRLRSKYGAPFTWAQNKSRDKTEVISSPLEGSSDISTPQSQVFTEIPKQPSIYPLELERNIDSHNLGISEFIKKSLKMQKTLELLLEHNTENNIKKT